VHDLSGYAFSGMNLRDALNLARDLGCTVAWVHRTGEWRVSHPTWGKSMRVNSRRKDAPRALSTKLRHLEGE